MRLDVAVWPAAPLLLSPSTRARSWVASRNGRRPLGPARLFLLGWPHTHSAQWPPGTTERRFRPTSPLSSPGRGPRRGQGARAAATESRARPRDPPPAPGAPALAPPPGPAQSCPEGGGPACRRPPGRQGPQLQESGEGPRAKASPAVPRFGNTGPPVFSLPDAPLNQAQSDPGSAGRCAPGGGLLRGNGRRRAAGGQMGGECPYAPHFGARPGLQITSPRFPKARASRTCPRRPNHAGPTGREGRTEPGPPSPSGAPRGSLPHAPSRPVREDGRGPRLLDKGSLFTRTQKRPAPASLQALRPDRRKPTGFPRGLEARGLGDGAGGRRVEAGCAVGCQ